MWPDTHIIDNSYVDLRIKFVQPWNVFERERTSVSLMQLQCDFKSSVNASQISSQHKEAESLFKSLRLKSKLDTIHATWQWYLIMHAQLQNLHIYAYSSGAADVLSEEFIIISHLFCLPNYLINSVVLIVMFTICSVEA